MAAFLIVSMTFLYDQLRTLMEFTPQTTLFTGTLAVKKENVRFNRGTGILTMEYSIANQSDYSNIPLLDMESGCTEITSAE